MLYEKIEPATTQLNEKKVQALEASMMKDGWIGRPILTIDGDYTEIAITGSHRIEAALRTNTWIPTKTIDPRQIRTTAGLRCLAALCVAKSDETRWAAICKLHALELVDDETLRLMNYEMLMIASPESGKVVVFS